MMHLIILRNLSGRMFSADGRHDVFMNYPKGQSLVILPASVNNKWWMFGIKTMQISNTLTRFWGWNSSKSQLKISLCSYQTHDRQPGQQCDIHTCFLRSWQRQKPELHLQSLSGLKLFGKVIWYCVYNLFCCPQVGKKTTSKIKQCT